MTDQESCQPRRRKWTASVVLSGAIEVRLGGNRSLVVEPGFDTRQKRELLSVLDTPASEDRLPGHGVFQKCAVKCAIPGAPKCAFKGLNATCGECFRAG